MLLKGNIQNLPSCCMQNKVFDPLSPSLVRGEWLCMVVLLSPTLVWGECVIVTSLVWGECVIVTYSCVGWVCMVVLLLPTLVWGECVVVTCSCVGWVCMVVLLSPSLVWGEWVCMVVLLSPSLVWGEWVCMVVLLSPVLCGVSVYGCHLLLCGVSECVWLCYFDIV